MRAFFKLRTRSMYKSTNRNMAARAFREATLGTPNEHSRDNPVTLTHGVFWKGSAGEGELLPSMRDHKAKKEKPAPVRAELREPYKRKTKRTK